MIIASVHPALKVHLLVGDVLMLERGNDVFSFSKGGHGQYTQILHA